MHAKKFFKKSNKIINKCITKETLEFDFLEGIFQNNAFWIKLMIF